MQFQVEIGRDKHKIKLYVMVTDDGINVLLTGGEKAHVGGVVLTVPRQSLTGSGIGSDSWVVPVPGHKDTIAGEKVGTIICRKTGEVVAVTAGIHIDNALPEDLEMIMENCLQGAQLAASKIIRLRAGQK
ncbi:MAG: hypothetical protein AAGU27_00600 [Dehalobacterium sp.]